MEWLNGGVNHIEPHKDKEISNERAKCLKRYFSNPDDRRVVNIEFAKFSTLMDKFSEHDSIHDRAVMDSKFWWVVHGSSTRNL